jgi:hypothetical protein
VKPAPENRQTPKDFSSPRQWFCRSAAAAGLLVGLFAGGPAAAAETCQAFPSNRYAGPVSHDQVIDYVASRLKGNWNAYIAQQTARLGQFKAMQTLGKPLAVRHQGAWAQLGGAELGDYIALTAARIEVLRCLAGNQAEGREDAVQAASELNGFATAAGGTQLSVTPKDTARPAEVARAPRAPKLDQVRLRNRPGSQMAPVDLEIVAACQKDTTIFKVVNKGPQFPEYGTIAIYQIGGPERRLLKNRRMRLSPGQSATFKIKGQINTTGQLGLYLNPSWYVRPSGLDSTINCG